MIRTLVLSLVALAPLQQEQPPSPERCPPVRHETCLRFFHLKGAVDRAKLNDAVRGAELELAYGPLEAASRPNNSMVAVTCPADLRARDVERALKKARLKVTELEVFHFRGRIENGYPTLGVGLKKIDYLLGISSDIKWCDRLEVDTIFYCEEGKLSAEELEDLFVKLQDPLGRGEPTLGRIVVDELTWTLPEALDEARAKRLTKAIGKLDGIASAELEGAQLRVELPLAAVVVSGPAQGQESEELESRAPPRVTRLTNELYDLLVNEGLTPRPTAGQ